MSATGRRRGGRGRRLHPVAIAGITIALIAAVTYYAFSQSIPFVHHFTMHAIVDNSVAVRTDSPVRIAGVDVGTVSNVSPAGRYTEVNFTLNDNAQPVHNDATVRIRSRLFLEGGYYLDLNPGSPSAPKVGDGFVIQPRNTVTPVQFYNVLSTFDAAARQSLENQLNTLNDAFSFQDSNGRPVPDPGAQGLKRTIPQLTPVFKDTAQISRALLGRGPNDMRNLLQSASLVTGTLADNSSQLADLVTGLNRTSSALASADGALAQTVSGVDQLLQTAPASLTAVDRALPPVTNLARTLDPSLRVAPPIVDRVTGAVRQLAVVVSPPVRGPLIASLRTILQAFPTTLGQIASLFPQTKPVTDCLRTRVTPTLQTVIKDGALTSGDPVWKEFIHFLPRIAGASGNFDANGHWIRYMLGVGTNTLNLGSLPILGPLLSNGTPTPNGNLGTIEGSSPGWVGDLTASAFRPDVECGSQPMPDFGSLRAASDVRGVSPSPAAPALDRAQLNQALARQARAVKGSAR